MPENLSESNLIESIQSTFIDSVKLRLRSDVNVGILLSGGIDSSAIAAAVHHIDPYRDNIRLISAVSENGDDEQSFIDIMGRHLKRNVEKVVMNHAPPSRLILSARQVGITMNRSEVFRQLHTFC